MGRLSQPSIRTWRHHRSCERGDGRIVYDAHGFAYNTGMSERPHPILIGCSGWSYPDWEGAFYPEGMRAGEYLEYYADRFPIVEVDSTFYRVPTARMVRGWRDRTPDDFKFALKVPQAITHQKQLRD